MKEDEFEMIKSEPPKILKSTLEHKINVPLRLLISNIFSHWYALISDGKIP